MIIKRWNSGTSSWDEQYPKTKAQLIRNDGDTDWIFDSNDKIKVNYLPDAVFDSLLFYDTWSLATSSATARADKIIAAIDFAIAQKRSAVGLYFVSTSNQTIGALSNQANTAANKTVTMDFAPTDAGSVMTSGQNSGALEAGDWFVINDYSVVGSVYNVRLAVINNVYNDATTTLDGIVRLSSRSIYADLAGNNVITEGVLKTVIDNASFAASGHVHGNITKDGKITTNTAAASGQHLVITSSADVVQQSAITFGSTTTTFLTNAGTWATPTGTYAHPTQTAINANATDDGINVIDSVTVNTLGHVTAVGTRNLSAATTSAPGHMSAADKTKLDGIATGANNYVHPTQTLTQAAGTETTLTDITLVDSLTTNSTGHLTNATWRKLVAGSNVSITAASDGNITIASTDTNTTYTASDGLELDGTNVEMVYPLFVQTATPSSPKASSIWLDIN